MSVLDFPHSDRAAQAGDYPTVGLPFIMRELGHRTYGLNRQIAYVSHLIAECGFPPPYPALTGKKGAQQLTGKKGAQQLTRDVVKDSSWSRLAVLVWLDDWLPPATAAALDDRAQRAAADEMDANAGGLKLIARNDA